MNENLAPGTGRPQRVPARAPEANLRAGTPYFLSKTLESAGFLGYNTR